MHHLSPQNCTHSSECYKDSSSERRVLEKGAGAKVCAEGHRS